ncbi:Mitochondrial inner membrane organizing system component, variant 2 [Salvia divinorum]|uniref:Mitochondrial inner membrane organizing system component, variant 2 n=1 Tax=Salvia divinorum TaxID=28513 RepID=A0ABD1GFM1_SALDI
MVEDKAGFPEKYDLNAKWDACVDLSLRRFVYSSFAGGIAGLLLFRSPVTRWASVAFGAGVGIGSAYSECAHKFNTSSPKFIPYVSETPLPEAGDE